MVWIHTFKSLIFQSIKVYKPVSDLLFPTLLFHHENYISRLKRITCQISQNFVESIFCFRTLPLTRFLSKSTDGSLNLTSMQNGIPVCNSSNLVFRFSTDSSSLLTSPYLSYSAFALTWFFWWKQVA